MNTTKIKSRLANLERKLPPTKDVTCTLAELCRAMYREQKRDFLKIARDSSLGYFVVEFEREDAEREGLARHRRSTGSRR